MEANFDEWTTLTSVYDNQLMTLLESAVWNTHLEQPSEDCAALDKSAQISDYCSPYFGWNTEPAKIPYLYSEAFQKTENDVSNASHLYHNERIYPVPIDEAVCTIYDQFSAYGNECEQSAEIPILCSENLAQQYTLNSVPMQVHDTSISTQEVPNSSTLPATNEDDYTITSLDVCTQQEPQDSPNEQSANEDVTIHITLQPAHTEQSHSLYEEKQHSNKDKQKKSKRKSRSKNKQVEALNESYSRSQFYCQLCDRSFARNTGLLQHNVARHSGANRYRCAKCGKKFELEDDLRKHEVRHDLEHKTFQCTSCTKTFANRCDLMRHIKVVHGLGAFLCKRCGKKAARADHLIMHMWSRHGEKPTDEELKPRKAEKVSIK